MPVQPSQQLHKPMIPQFPDPAVGGEAESFVTTLGIALLSFLSQDMVIFLLGAALAVVRLTYEIARLWKFLSNRTPKDPENDG